MATVAGVDQSFSFWTCGENAISAEHVHDYRLGHRTSLIRFQPRKNRMAEDARGGVWLTTRVLAKSEPHSIKERSSTELRFTSFRVRL